MPIVWKKDIATHTHLGLWKICQEELSGDTCAPNLLQRLSDKCATRRLEIAATHALLYEMTGRKDITIGHETSGKPFLQDANGKMVNCQIGISHTLGYASLIISEDQPVAVDIEFRSDRVKRIAKRFMRKDELCEMENQVHSSSTQLTRLLLHWCAKETVYKLYSDESLTFQNMRVCSINEIAETGSLQCQNLTNGETPTIHYIQNEDFVITYCIKGDVSI